MNKCKEGYKQMLKTLIKAITISALLLVAGGILTGSVLRKPSRQSSSIVGSWISEADSNWKLKFTSERCYQYYADTLVETDHYVISNTSPQCGSTVPVDNYTSYLKLSDLNDTTSIICYHINGINSKNLSLTMVGRGGQMVFERIICLGDLPDSISHNLEEQSGKANSDLTTTAASYKPIIQFY
jgi:hypothetical protein